MVPLTQPVYNWNKTVLFHFTSNASWRPHKWTNWDKAAETTLKL